MTDYYVSTSGNNANDGLSLATAWRDNNFAVNNAAVGPGDRIITEAGTYNERVFATINNGAVANPIEWITTGGPVIIDGQYSLPGGTPAGDSGATCPVSNTVDNPLPSGTTFTGLDFVFGGLVHFRNVSHWIIDGIEVINSRGRGITLEQTTNVTCRNVRIDGCRAAMWWTNGTDSLVEDSDMRDGGNFFPYSRSVSCANWPVGVNMINADGPTVQRNCIYHHWGEGVGTGRDSSNITIVGNISYDNMAMDFYDHFGENVLIDGNFIYRTLTNKYNRGANPPTCFVRNMEQSNFPNAPAAANHTVTNNLIIGRDNYSMAIWGNQGGADPVGQWTAANNTLINTDTGLGRGYPLHSITNGNTDTDARFHNNILIRISGGSVFDGSNIASAAWSWQNNAASSTLPSFMQSANDVTVQASDLAGPLANPAANTKWDSTVGNQLSSSPTVDAGLATLAPSVDYYDQARPAGAADDIGFHELSGNILPIITNGDVTGNLGIYQVVDIEVVDPDGNLSDCQVSGLPPGIFDGLGTMGGTPTAVGTYTVTIECFDIGGGSTTHQFNWTITGNIGYIVNYDPTDTGTYSKICNISQYTEDDDPVVENFWYVDSSAAAGGDGSQASPWQDFSDIDYAAIDASADKVVFVAGGTYNDPLVPTGTVQEFRATGIVNHVGPRPEQLVQCGETNFTEYTNTGQSGIDLSNAPSGLLINGGQWNGWKLSRWQSDGVEYGNSTANTTLRYMSIYDNGYMTRRTTWDCNRTVCGSGLCTFDDPAGASSPNGAGVRYAGQNNRIEMSTILNNGQDALLSQNAATNLNGFFIDSSIVGNTRLNTRPKSDGSAGSNGGGPLAGDGSNEEAWNYCAHTDGMQNYSGGTVNGLSITNTAILLSSNGIIWGQTGSTPNSVQNGVLDNVLIYWAADTGILSYPGIRNDGWDLNDVTIYGPHTKNAHLEATSESQDWTVRNVVAYGGGAGFGCSPLINFFGSGPSGNGQVGTGSNNFADSGVTMGTGASLLFTQQAITFTDEPMNPVDFGFDLTPNVASGSDGTLAAIIGASSVSSATDADGNFAIT